MGRVAKMKKQIESFGYKVIEDERLNSVGEINIAAMLVDLDEGEFYSLMYADNLTLERKISVFNRFLEEIKNGTIEKRIQAPCLEHKGVSLITFYR